MQQALQELDKLIGQEILKLLPTKLDTLSVITGEDNVFANSGIIGTTVHRTWGGTKKAEMDIISNSPIVASISAILNSPMAGMMNDKDMPFDLKRMSYGGFKVMVSA